MADETFGTSFSPLQTLRGGPGQASRGGAAKPSSTQEAIRTISTRIPTIRQGGRSIAPAPLLSAPGGMAVPQAAGSPQAPGMGLEEILRRLFGLMGQGSMGAPSQAAPMASPGGAPFAQASMASLGAPQVSQPASAPKPRIQVGIAPSSGDRSTYQPAPEPAPMGLGHDQPNPARMPGGAGGTPLPSLDELTRLLSSINV